MAKLEIDLKKLGNLQEEIKILSVRKGEIERDAEKIRNNAIKEKRESDKAIAKIKEDFEIYKREVERNHKKINTSFTEREKELIIKEKEGRDIAKDIQVLNSKRRELLSERKEIDRLRSISLDREHKANLLIAQYNKMTGELPQEIEVKKKIIKKKKR